MFRYRTIFIYEPNITLFEYNSYNSLSVENYIKFVLVRIF